MSLVRAAQYVRMSTEHQNYSIGHQEAAIAVYAATHGMTVVRTFADEGISGLRIDNRPGLKDLLTTVVSGQADFEVILAYDVSRWGRFQDPDQAAHYEFICKQAGARVEYCAEPFINDGSLTSTLVKQLKRAMAAEYSRELSVKVSEAQRRLFEMGYWQGGPPGFGLRRQVARRDGKPGATLEAGEYKGANGDHVVLIHGPADEVDLVRRIYRMYLVHGMSRAAISRQLNRENLIAEHGAAWSPSRVDQVLSNEKYAGAITFGKSSGYMERTRRFTPKPSWKTAPNALAPIVSPEVFKATQRNLKLRCRRMSDADMLKGLAALLKAHGRLTSALIKDAEHLPCPHVYRYRFGGLIQAFARVGYTPSDRALKAGEMTRKGQAGRRRGWASCMSDDEMIERLRRLYASVGSLSHAVIDNAVGMPGGDLYRKRFGGMLNVYAMVGYQPTAKQRLAVRTMTRRSAAEEGDGEPAAQR